MKTDKTTTISDLKLEVKKFIKERGWDRFQTLRALAISLSLESNEFLDHFQWLNDKEVEELEKDVTKHEELAEELCDILSYLLTAADKLNVDLTKVFLNKLEKNRKKYPIETFHEGNTWEEDNKKYQDRRKAFE